MFSPAFVGLVLVFLHLRRRFFFLLPKAPYKLLVECTVAYIYHAHSFCGSIGSSKSLFIGAHAANLIRKTVEVWITLSDSPIILSDINVTHSKLEVQVVHSQTLGKQNVSHMSIRDKQ